MLNSLFEIRNSKCCSNGNNGNSEISDIGENNELGKSYAFRNSKYEIRNVV